MIDGRVPPGALSWPRSVGPQSLSLRCRGHYMLPDRKYIGPIPATDFVVVIIPCEPISISQPVDRMLFVFDRAAEL